MTLFKKALGISHYPSVFDGFAIEYSEGITRCCKCGITTCKAVRNKDDKEAVYYPKCQCLYKYPIEMLLIMD